MESANPTGSAKDRTALGLLRALERDAPLHPGTVVIESTSGNLGLALARQLSMRDCRLIAVTDPNTPERSRRALAQAGAQVIVVDEPDGQGGFLLTRLGTVRRLCAENPGYRWTNQYENPANPEIHQELTGPEILKQAGPDLDAVYIAVSTGGTLAGVSRYLKQAAPAVRLIAVDAAGSLATGQATARRIISGIGASRPSSFLNPQAYYKATAVSDAEAIALCRTLAQDTGLTVGGSSGSVLHACLADLAEPDPPRLALCLLADGGWTYRETVYSDTWLEHKNVLADVRAAQRRLRERGVSFSLRAGLSKNDEGAPREAAPADLRLFS